MLLTQFKLGHSFLEDTITYQGRWWKKYCDEINMRQVSSFRYWHTCWVEMLSVQPVALIARCVIASENDLLTTVQCTLGTVIRVTVQFIFHVTYQITFHGYLLWWWSETSFPFGRVLCHWCCTHVYVGIIQNVNSCSLLFTALISCDPFTKLSVCWHVVGTKWIPTKYIILF